MPESIKLLASEMGWTLSYTLEFLYNCGDITSTQYEEYKEEQGIS